MSHDSSWATLTIEQASAIDLVMAGLSDREVAEKVGVSRETVNRWRNRHPAFRAELNRRRRALWDNGLDRLRLLFPEAVEALRTAVKDPGNRNGSRVALEVVKMARVPEGYASSIGPQDPEEIVEEEARRRRSRLRLSEPPSEYEIVQVVEELEEEFSEQGE